MALSFAALVRVPAGVLLRELAGEAVILNVNTGTYFGLDEVGTCMWRACTEAPSLQSAYETLLEEYDVDPELLRRDLDSFLTQLANYGLLEVGSPSAGWAEVNGQRGRHPGGAPGEAV